MLKLKRNRLVAYHTDLVLIINVAHRLHLQNRSLILTSATRNIISSGKSSCSLLETYICLGTVCYVS